MISEKFSIGKLSRKVFDKIPSLRFRSQSDKIHNASEATRCKRQVTYKALGYEPSNPTDYLGQWRMKFGNWVERGLIYDLFAKMNLFGVHLLSSQGTAGEYGTFYGATWHGYRDIDMAITDEDGTLKPVVVEVKSKVGFGAKITIHPTAFSTKSFIIPEPDQEWGYSQQIGLYLRNAYLESKQGGQFKNPIRDGILLYFLYADGLCGLVEFYCEYQPDEDSIHFYRVHCEEYPECSGPLDITIPLKPIADHWLEIDRYIEKKELAPPGFTFKYPVDSHELKTATKTDLTKASKNQKLIGDKQCMYCPYRDKCAQDQGIDLNYNKTELATIKKVLSVR